MIGLPGISGGITGNQQARGRLRAAAAYFVPLPRAEERRIWERWKQRRIGTTNPCCVPEEERVEDAALTDKDVQPATRPMSSDKRNVLRAPTRDDLYQGGRKLPQLLEAMQIAVSDTLELVGRLAEFHETPGDVVTWLQSPHPQLEHKIPEDQETAR